MAGGYPKNPGLGATMAPMLIAALLAGCGGVSRSDYKQNMTGLSTSHDYDGLSRQFWSADTESFKKATLRWSRRETMRGGGVFVTLLYAGRAWQLGNAPDAGDDAPKLKDTAAEMVLYAVAVAKIDGPKCGDQSAPGSRVRLILARYRPILAYAGQWHAGTAESEINKIIDLEADHANDRGNDDWLCRFGVDNKLWIADHDPTGTASDAIGSSERPSGSNNAETPGRTAGNYTPSFQSPEFYQPYQRAERPLLHDSLMTVLNEAAASATAAP